MAVRMGVRQLRDTLTSTIRRVRAGESVEITLDGQPVALLTPLPADRIARLVAAGDVTASRPLGRPMRRYPVTGPKSASEALEEDRAER
jgi:antitoxin (DNA-binding transcriptional repressor) of toxin-antitoxin stability system